MSSRTADEGSSVVELVIIAPLLILVMMFLVLIGRLSISRQELSEAAHSAARSASLATSPEQAAATAFRVLGTFSGSAACASHDVQVDTSDFRPGGVVRVIVSCHVRVADLVGLIPGTTTITESSVSPVDPFRAT